MKQIIYSIAALGFLATALHAEDKTELKTQREKASYSIGYEMGSGMKQQKLDIDTNSIVNGLRDGFSGQKGLLTPEEMRAVMETFEKDLEARMQKEALTVPENNKKEGASFLVENKKKEGVKTLPSGLQYKVLREGTGPSPKPEDKVTTHYRGTLIDGTEFDSSYSRREPTSFGVGQVIKGWQEALQLMKAGSKWQLFIPSDLAYGAAGAGRSIGPNATLIFEIELISIDKQ